MNKITKIIISFLLTAVIIAVLFRYYITPSDILDAFKHLSAKLIAIMFLLYVAVQALRAWRNTILLNNKIKYKSFFAITCLHNMLAQIVPFRLGELSFIYFLKKHRIPIGSAFSTLILSRIYDLLTIGILFIPAVIATPVLPERISAIVGIIGVELTLLIIIIICAAFFRKRVIKLLNRIAVFLRVHNWWITNWGIVKADETLKSLRTSNSKRAFAHAFPSSILVWIAQYLSAYLLAMAIGLPVTISQIILGFGLAILTALLPVQGIAGFGTTEVAWGIALTAFGIETAKAFAFGFVYHATQISFLLITGGIGAIIRWNED